MRESRRSEALAKLTTGEISNESDPFGSTRLKQVLRVEFRRQKQTGLKRRTTARGSDPPRAVSGMSPTAFENEVGQRLSLSRALISLA